LRNARQADHTASSLNGLGDKYNTSAQKPFSGAKTEKKRTMMGIRICRGISLAKSSNISRAKHFEEFLSDDSTP